MSRPSRRSLLGKYNHGDQCERKKPCDGTLELDHEKSFAFSGVKFQWWCCNKCGKKHYAHAKKA